jgi:hypothetical protein
LSGVGGGPAVSGVACGAPATGSGDFALGGDSFAIFESSPLRFLIFGLGGFFSWICFPRRFGFVGIVRFAGFDAFYTNRLAEHRQSLQHQCRFALGPLLCEKRARK